MMKSLNLNNVRYTQYISAITAALQSAAYGMANGWPSPTLLKFQSDDSPIGEKLSDDELSWVVSVTFLASSVGSMASRYSVDYLGRKRTLLLASTLTFTHWLCLIFANSLALLITARILTGISAGIGVSTIIIYLGEISEDDIRGKLGSYLIFLTTIGTVSVLIIGPIVSYTTLGIICASVPVICFVTLIFIPESPYYYMKIGKKEDARKSLIKLSKTNVGDKFIEERLAFIEKTVDGDMKTKGNFITLLTKKEFRWILFLLFAIKSLQQFSGSMAIEAYIQPIIESANTGVPSGIASIIVGCIQIPSVFICGFLIDKLGRKPLLISAATVCCVALLGEGSYFLLQDHLKKDTTALGWLPTTGLVLFSVMNPIIHTVPMVLLGEIFPINIKGAGIAIAVTYGSSSAFIVTKFFKPLSNAIGIYSVFYIFAGVCFVGALFVFFLLPETKGRNFQEIQELLKGKNKKKMNCLICCVK